MTKSNKETYWKNEKNFANWQESVRSVMEFIKQLDPAKQRRVLDLGCGIGGHALLFARAGFDVTAVDDSLEAINEVRNKAEELDLDVKTILGNFRDYLFDDEYFDVVLSYDVLHRGSYQKFAEAIKLCKDYLKPSGLLFFSCPTRMDAKYGDGEEIAPYTYKLTNQSGDDLVYYFADEKDIQELTEGFEIDSIEKNENYSDVDGTKQLNSCWEVIVRKL